VIEKMVESSGNVSLQREFVKPMNLFFASKPEIKRIGLDWIREQVKAGNLKPDSKDDNEYYKAFRLVDGEHYLLGKKHENEIINRWDFTSYWSWAVPINKAIEMIAKYSPIIEIGAGKGYWANLISKKGGIIHAYDKKPYMNHWCSPGKKYYPVSIGTTDVLKERRYRNCSLFICWPPFLGELACEALKAFKGDIFIYIGESSGGCTGNDLFFMELEEHWREIESQGLPNWEGMNDYLAVYERRSKQAIKIP
jgi:hypothetical protein